MTTVTLSSERSVPMEDVFLPLPRVVACRGWWTVHPGQVEVIAESEDETLGLAASELGPLVGGGARAPAAEPSIRLRLAVGADKAIPDTGHQAYAIVPEPDGLRLIGADPVGAYYAVKTLKQAIRSVGDQVLVPQLAVSDSADLAERGFWDFMYPSPVRETYELHTFTTKEQWFALIDDFSDYKINLMELLVTGEEGSVLCYNSARFPELVSHGVPPDKNELIRAVMAYARPRGVKIIPTTCHPEHFWEMLKQHPETKAVNPEGCQPSMREKLLCFSHPKTREVFAGVFEEIVDLFEPEALCIWFPEHMGHCTCPSCRDWIGAAKAYLRTCEEAKSRICSKRPGFRMRYEGGFMRYSDQMLSLWPADSELEYYECDRHGLYGFDENKRLPDRVVRSAQTGRRVVGCMSYRGMGLRYVPLPYFDNIRGWVETLVQGGAYGISGSIYSNPGVQRWNLLCMADAAWNLAGRTSEGFVRAMLEREAGHDSAARATIDARKGILLALSDAWYLSHQLQCGTSDRHALTRIRDRRPMDYLDACYLVDSLEERELPRLRQRVTELESAVQQAAELGDELLHDQTRVALDYLSYQFHVFSALHVYGRQMWPDPEKGPWTDWVEELVRHVRQAAEHIAGLPDLIRRIPSRYPEVTADPPIPAAVDAVPKLLDAILDPVFKERLREIAWPDIRSFA